MASTLKHKICTDIAPFLPGSMPDRLPDDCDLIGLGLDSLAMMKLAAMWRRQGYDISFARLIQQPRFDAWLALIESQPQPEPRGKNAALPGLHENEPFPLALMQHAYWVGRDSSQHLGGVAAHFYHEFDRPQIDAARLESAVRQLLARHGMLRVVILDEGQQQVLEEGRWPGMKLLGEPGKLVASVPVVARSLNLALGFGGVAGLLNVSGIALLAWAVTPLLHTTTLQQSSLLALIGSIVVLMLAFFLRLQAEERAHEASYKLEESLRERLVEHLSRLPLGVVQGWGSGRLRKIIQDDVKALHIAVADAVPFIGASLSQPLAALLLLALVALLLLPVSIVCMAMMARENPHQRARYNEASEVVNAGVIELVQGMAVMRTFDNGAAGWQRFSSRLQQFTSAVEAWMASSKLPWKINRLVGAALPTATVLMMAGFALYSAEQVTLAQWLLALMLGTLPIKAFEPLVHLANYLNDAGVASRRIGEVLAQPVLPEPQQPQVPQGHILCLNKISFIYPGQQHPALSEVSLTLAPGMRCAIVGVSGSGKSTLARLIPRFYDVTEGSITLGGCDIRQMRSDVLLQQMALVLQEPFLISGTLEENLRLMPVI